jgi:cobalt/nickel transport system permease protein
MRHDFIDKYSDRNSPIHRIDARVKIFCVFAFIVLATSVMNIYALAASAVLLTGVFIVSRVPLKWAFVKASIVVPVAGSFALVKAFTTSGSPIASCWILNLTSEGVDAAALLFFRAFISVYAIVLLTSTTRFPTLLAALEKLKVPTLITSMISFTYRYIFVFTDEAERLERAKASKCIQGAQYKQRLSASAKTIGLVFIKAYERGERIYRSMLARGFDGTINTLDVIKMTRHDLLGGITFIALIALLTVILR